MAAPTTPACTAVIFRHVQKTGGVSVRDFFAKLERDSSWRSYAEGPPSMLGSRRCGPSLERRRERCSVYQLSPLRILEELATECAASQLRGRAASRTPFKAFVELHNRGSYSAALEFAERSLRPAGWRVVTAVLLREPVAQLASWFLFDGLRSDRCGVTPKNKRGRACTAVEYVEKRAARAPGGLQAFLIAGGNKTEPPAAVHARAAALLERSTIVGTTERLPAFFGELCSLLDIGCAGAPGRPAECAAPPTVAYQAYPRLRRSFLDKQQPGWPHGDAALEAAVQTHFAVDIALHKRFARRPFGAVHGTATCALRERRRWIRLRNAKRVPDDCVPGRPADAPLVPPKLRASLSPVLSAWVDRRKDERWALCAADTAAALAPGANATSAWLHAHQLYTPSDTHLLQLQHETDPDGGVGDAAWIASRVDCEGCLKPTDLAAGRNQTRRWERPNWVDHGFAVKAG